MKKLSLLIFFLPQFIIAQDSLRLFRLLDISIQGITKIAEEPSRFSQLQGLTKNEGFKSEAQGYKKRSYMSTDTIDSGYDAGITIGFKHRVSKHKFVNRIKPRLGIFYAERTFVNADLNYESRQTTDTLYYTNPNIKPKLIDSTTSGSIYYKLFSRQLLLEAGINVDIKSSAHFIFYTGLFFTKGFGISNTLTMAKRESYKIAPYPGKTTGASGITSSLNINETTNRSSLYRVCIPIGLQFRFVAKKTVSPGFFVEYRPCFETFSIKDAGHISRFIFSISGGLRLYLQKYK